MDMMFHGRRIASCPAGDDQVTDLELSGFVPGLPIFKME